LNIFEWIIGCVFLACALATLRWLLKDWRTAAGITLLLIIPTLLAVERATQVQTVDDARILLDVVWGVDRQWNLVAMRTSYVVLGLLSRALQGFTPQFILDDVNLYQTVLAAHWLISAVTMLPIIAVIGLEFAEEKQRKLAAATILPVMLILPTTFHAFKVFNYDALSMNLGVLSLLLAVASLRKPRLWMALTAVFAGFLATQEKLSASPILFFALIAAGIAAGDGREGWQRILRVLIGSAAGVLIAAGTGVASSMIFGWLARATVWTYVRGSVEPLMQWYAALSMFLPGDSVEASELIQYIPLLVLAVAAAASLLAWLKQRLHIDTAAPAPRWLLRLYAMGVLLMLVSAIAGIYLVEAYYAPAIPIQPGNYWPSDPFNGNVLHFQAASGYEHVLKYCAYAYAWFVTSLPSVVFLSALVIGLHPRQRVTWDEAALLYASALFPATYVVARLPIISRYLNIWLLVMAIFVILLLVRLLEPLWTKRQWALPLIVTALIVAETLPFRPIEFSFRPFWVIFPAQQAMHAEVGHVDPLWPGSGEEVLLTALYLSETCGQAPGEGAGVANQACEKISLYPFYTGRWLARPGDIPITISVNQAGGVVYPESGPPTTPYDYYLFNRNAISQGLVTLPDNLEPEYTLAYQGYAIAWLYRGDKLAAAGYTW